MGEEPLDDREISVIQHLMREINELKKKHREEMKLMQDFEFLKISVVSGSDKEEEEI